MRDQIITGIRNAVTNAYQGRDEHLYYLNEDEVETIADAVLAALAEVPDGTPAPEATMIAADTPVITFSAADVVAMLAGAARNADLRDDTIWGNDPENDTDTLPRVVIRTHRAFEDHKAFRQFMLAIQTVFGVRCRFVRDGAGDPEFIVAGTPRGIDAFDTALDTFRAAALDYTTGISEDEQATFWATLGAVVADNDRAAGIAADNEATYTAATRVLREALGPARTLRRTTPVTDGPVYERATAVAADAAARGL